MCPVIVTSNPRLVELESVPKKVTSELGIE